MAALLGHRLDKDTSGPFVVAEDQDAWNQLRLTSSTHRWYKRYQALIHGVVLVKRLVPQKDTGTPRRSDHAERLIRGPTMQRCGELLAEERPSSQGGLQPQNRAQRPLHRRRQFGIRGHGHDNMDLRTCANTGLTKKRSPPAAQLLRVAETSAPCSPRSAKMVPLAAT